MVQLTSLLSVHFADGAACRASVVGTAERCDVALLKLHTTPLDVERRAIATGGRRGVRNRAVKPSGLDINYVTYFYMYTWKLISGVFLLSGCM